VRRAATDVLLAVGAGRATLADELARARLAFSDERDRALLMELTAGVLRWRLLLDHLIAQAATRSPAEIHETVLTVLRIGAYELRFLTRMPEHAVVSEAVESVRALRQGRASGFVNAVLRSLARQRDTLAVPLRPEPTADRDAWLTYLSTSLSHPRWLAARYLDRAGAERAEAWCRYNLTVPPVTLRAIAGANRADEAGVARALANAGASPLPATPGAWHAGGARVPDDIAALVTVQDEASQRVAAFAAVAPGERVLDVCAAPGGKSALFARAAGAAGTVVSSDIRPRRVRVLAETLQRERVPAHIVRLDGERLPFGPVFDRVVVDAPCSGLGTVARDPDVKWSRDEAALGRYAVLQTQLLDEAARAVAPGGRLVYATCSSEPEENADVVAAFLAAHPEFTRETDDFETRPDRDGVDAFYAARLVRREGA
jgi:16S rRNA (cytosine967-C5)-methyltransferase